MRRVKFKYYDEKTRLWIDETGFFHQWGASYEEFESGAGNYTTAIIEDDGGKIHEAPPQFVIFLTPPTPKNLT